MSSSQSKHSSNERQLSPTYASFAPSSSSPPQNTSPLLSSTPPTITKALSQAYPLILATDRVFSLLTWTSDDSWKSFLLVVTWVAIVLYYEVLIKYFGHLLIVGGIAGYVYFNQSVEKERIDHPTLDSIVHTLTNATTRVNLFFSPITLLSLTPHDVTRLLFTTLFMSPVYMIIAFFLISPKTIILLFGLIILTYHSVYARVTRAVLWRSRTIRLFGFYLTGLDFSGSRIRSHETHLGKRNTSMGVQSKDGKPVRFVYVLYENQRRWLGIGWTANLLAYERAPWTDEFLNESTSPDSFKLPVDDNFGVKWKWVDKTWKLDLTNDGALVVTGSKSKLTPDPSNTDGWVFYDNTWKKPSTEDTFLKYTRRRRWVRTAELVNTSTSSVETTESRPIISSTPATSSSSFSSSTATLTTNKSPTNTTPINTASSKNVSSNNSSGESVLELSKHSSSSTGIEKSENAKARKSLRFAED